ncbi:hypothetical protein BO99DRAFT_407272 [Aspergillus violaceofuscus CBS 115571]|uniref:F-box domain-containing protein n=1 Tax=Aspergillus violaceofuscus (strain CBS 115571) TaxID=1450538 RepID=A0A2V5GRE2_ASPV1|nr:hypothetical protein BO99DRAFT_407272 [Aspergillus violaceofuscus CBS 115571]
METLPTELIDTIVSWLDLRDVCALRLTGRTISSHLSTAGILRRFFSSKRLEMTKAPLAQLVHFTQPGQVGLWLQRLTLYDCVERTEQSGANFDATELLAQAFANIRDRPPPHRDDQLSLSISLEVDNFSTWDRDVTARVFHPTISAIARTEIPIRELDIFGDAYVHDHHFEDGQCSLAFSDIALALSHHRVPLATSLRNCTKFCLSLGYSTRGFDFESSNSTRNFRLPLTVDEARQNTQSLCDLLNMCPLLEELQLVWEYDDLEETDACREEIEFFDRVGLSCAFTNLKRCKLQHISTSENPVMTFFRQSPRMVELTLDGLYMTPGNFSHLFHLLSTAMSDLDSLRLRLLTDDLGSLYFFHEPKESTWHRKPGSALHGIRRRGADARRLVVPTNRR